MTDRRPTRQGDPDIGSQYGITSDGGEPVERKVQRTGGSSYTVSLPKSWAQTNGIEAGSSLFCYPHHDRLVLAPIPQEDVDRTIEIDVDEIGSETLPQRLIAAYAAGNDRIVVRSDTGVTTADRNTTSQVITSLSGIEIHTETEREIVARSLLDASKVSLIQSLSQIRRITLAMHCDAIEAVRENDDELARSIARRDDDVDRLYTLISRQFHRGLVDVSEIDRLDLTRPETFSILYDARQLERIADHAERIAAVASQQPDPPADPIADRIDRLAEGARDVVVTALNGDPEAALSRHDAVIDGVESLDRALFERGDPAAYRYGTVVESIRRTAEYGRNIAENAIRMDLKR